MTYENKPGNGALFKNDRKEKDTHPDYKGDVKLPDGTDCWIAAWLKDGKNGKFLSLSIQPKEARHGDHAGGERVPGSGQTPVDLDDSIPF